MRRYKDTDQIVELERETIYIGRLLQTVDDLFIAPAVEYTIHISLLN